MTYNEILNIAKKLDKEIKKKIDNDVEERMEILAKGELNREELMKMEECLYMSLVIQEYLNGEMEILEEERLFLLEEMEELYNEYGSLLSKAKLEEKLSKKKMMALELRRIREELFNRKKNVKLLKDKLQENQKNIDNLKKTSSLEEMEVIVNEKKGLKNPDKGLKLGIGGLNRVNDSSLTNIKQQDSYTEQEIRNMARDEIEKNKEVILNQINDAVNNMVLGSDPAENMWNAVNEVPVPIGVGDSYIGTKYREEQEKINNHGKNS